MIPRSIISALMGAGLALILGIAAPAGAEPVVATGKGKATIRDGNVDAAREEAREAALDDALVRAAARTLGVDEMDWTDDQTDLVELKILPQRGEFTDTWSVVNDGPDGNVYRVTIKAVFHREKLSHALLAIGVKQRTRTWGRVMVVIPEQHLTRFIPDPAAETEIVRQFVEAGYKVVDAQQIQAIRYNDQASAAAKGDNAAAAAIGRKFGAEIIIVGEAFSQAVEGFGGRPTCRARVEARMLRTDDATILAAHGAHQSAPEASEELASKKSLANAGGAVARYFLDQMDKRARTEAGQPRAIELVVSGIAYRNFAVLKDAMKDRIAGILRYNQRNYESERAELEVEFSDGDAQVLADALATTTFPGFRLTVVKASANRVDMKAAPRR